MPIASENLIASALTAAPVWTPDEKVAAVVVPLVGAAVAVLVHRVVQRTPWPRPFRLCFVGLHIAVAVTALLAWLLVSSAIQALILGTPFRMSYWESRALIGAVMYTMVVGVAYAIESSARAARAEAVAARTQLAALRSQIHPHFLFNALHAVVQLIPVEPARAAEAAELVADLLRTAVDSERDEVTLAEEWEFVSRYLAIERIRFGDRLIVRAEIDGPVRDARVPTFALQTLVENAVRHGAANRAEPTAVGVIAHRDARALTLTVRNATDGNPAPGAGTGLARLRERLAVLYGTAARLSTRGADGVFEAELVVPQRRGDAA